MSNRIRIGCINRTTATEPWDRITSIGGINPTGSRWKISQSLAIDHVDQGTYAFYVQSFGKEVDVIVAGEPGHRYLKASSDREQPNALLHLPECP
jgi:Protein of unknown function (DUF3892)